MLLRLLRGASGGTSIAGETDFAAVLQSESAAVQTRPAAPCARRPAIAPTAHARLLLRRSADHRTHVTATTPAANGRRQVPVPPADHRRRWKGGNAAALRAKTSECGLLTAVGIRGRGGGPCVAPVIPPSCVVRSSAPCRFRLGCGGLLSRNRQQHLLLPRRGLAAFLRRRRASALRFSAWTERRRASMRLMTLPVGSLLRDFDLFALGLLGDQFLQRVLVVILEFSRASKCPVLVSTMCRARSIMSLVSFTFGMSSKYSFSSRTS